MNGAEKEIKYAGNLLQSRGVCWYAAVLLTLVAVYVGSGRLGLSQGAVNGFATLIWFPSGFAVTLLFVMGFNLLPEITLGALLVNLLA